MKSVSAIEWTDNSIEHISRHGVIPEEIEEACFNEDDVPYIRSGSGKLHYVFGCTSSGRHLFIVVKESRRGQVKVITARDMNDWER